MTTGLDLAGIYERAAEWLEGHEWIQGENFLTTDGKRHSFAVPDPEDCAGACAEGALRICGGDRGAIHRMNKYVGDQTLFIWNDKKGRTKAEVIAKLKEAASAAREAGGEE
jgi:hypothetical protein